MQREENSGIPTDESTKHTDKNLNSENEIENNEDKNSNDDTEKTEVKKSDTKQSAAPEKKKRKHKKYKTSINHLALKELEGTTANSFLDLANAVILIDNASYDETYLPMSKARKNDFKRLIEHYAVIVVIGKRKYYVKQVYSKKQKEELNDMEINTNRDKSKK